MNIIEQYRILHQRGAWFKGTAIKGYTGDIGNLIEQTGAKTLLDYGCGKATYYLDRMVHEDWGVPLPYLYDPGVVKQNHVIKSVKPPKGTKFDGVICTDVLEHVENPKEVVQELLDYAEKFLFCTISCRHSNDKKRLLDGRGLHISVYPPDWWRPLFVKDGLKIELRFDIEELERTV